MKLKIKWLIYLMILFLIFGCKKKNEFAGTVENTSNSTKTIKMRDANEFKTTWDKIENIIDINSNIKTDFNQIYGKYIDSNIPNATATNIQKLYSFVQDPNKNPPAAKKALAFFIKANSKEIVIESLINPNKDIPGWSLVITASEALRNTSNGKPLPYLIYVLDKNNYFQPGSEIAGIHTRMKLELIKTIQQITNIDIKMSTLDTDNPDEVEKILSKARDWAKKNNIKLLDE